MSRNFMLIALGTWLVLLLAACGGTTPPANDAPSAPEAPTATPIPLEGEAVVYVVAPLSGPDAEEGQAQAAGARLAAATLNAQGGLMGQQVVVRVLNDRGTPEGARNAAQTIADASGDNIVGIVLSETSDPALSAAREVYFSPDNGLNALVVVAASTNPLASQVDDPRFFRLSALNVAQAAEIAAVMTESNLRDVMAVHSATETAIALRDRFERAANDYGLNVMDSVEVVAQYPPEFNAVADSIMAENPAAMFLATDPFETSQLLRSLYAQDYQGAIYAADDALPYAVVDELGCQAEGLYRAFTIPGPASAMSVEQRQQYAASEGRVAEPFSVAGYAGVEFVVNSFNALNANDATAVGAHVRENGVTTLLGELRFDEAGNRLDAQMHFQQVQARLFRDNFARLVGLPPEMDDDSDSIAQSYLEIDFADEREPIIFADLNWNSALFNNAIARTIIESGYGYPTQAVPGSTVPSFQRLVSGDVDLIMERYNFDNSYNNALDKGQIVDLGVNFTDPVQGWYVPRYVVEGDAQRGIEPAAPNLVSVNDLENVVDTFNAEGGLGQFYGGVPGWTAHKINCMKLKAYRLDDDYAQVNSASSGDLFGTLTAAYEAGDPVLVYLWSPTWPIAEYDLIQLEEPAYDEQCWQTTRGCAYPSDPVRILAHPSLPERAPEVTQFLRDFELDIAAVNEAMLRIEDEALTPDEAARLWLNDNEAIWSAWVPDDVAERVRAQLAETG